MEIVTLECGTQLHSICRLVSKKRKAMVAPRTDKVSLSGTFWDSGSRSDYYLVNLETMRAQPLAGVAPMQFGGPKDDPVHPLLPGFAIVQAGTFCGRPATPVVYLPKE